METARAIHAAFNARDWGALQACFAEGCIFIDVRGHNLIGAGEVVAGYAEPWVESFSDGRLIEDIYYDAGDTVVAEFTGKGTNDGYVGSLPPTGLPVELPYVHILHFNDEGRVNFGRAYYDQLSLLQQLGYA